MNEEEVIAQSATAPTMYFDGFCHFQKINGVLRCTGYVFGVGAQLNIVSSLAGAEQANRDARRALDEKSVKAVSIWNGSRLAH